jgi:hypothetical protein
VHWASWVPGVGCPRPPSAPPPLKLRVPRACLTGAAEAYAILGESMGPGHACFESTLFDENASPNLRVRSRPPHPPRKRAACSRAARRK